MRKVRIATTSFLIEDTTHTVEMNLERALAYIDEAKEKKADIICLPETCTTVGLSGDHPLEAEDFPGRWTKTFSRKASERRINLIAPYLVRVGKRTYNQATVFDRRGRILGFYRKIQPTAAESRFIKYDSKFPVFKMDFGMVAIMICMDIYFPEIPRIYGFKGAEVLFWPTVSHGPTQSALETQVKARALDNSLVVVESNLAGHPPYAPYSGRWRPGMAKIIDHNGDVIATTGRRHGVACADIDLDEVRLTSQCVLIREPDRMREDLASITRLDLYGGEYLKIAKRQKRYY